MKTPSMLQDGDFGCLPSGQIQGPILLPLLSIHGNSCALCMFLVNIEVTIVGTSLISITNDFRGFRQMSWIVTAYLITYASEHLQLYRYRVANCLHRHAHYLDQAKRHIWAKVNHNHHHVRLRCLLRGLPCCPDNDTAVRHDIQCS